MNAAAYIRAFAWFSFIAMTLFLAADFWILLLLLLAIFVIYSCVKVVR